MYKWETVDTDRENSSGGGKSRKMPIAIPITSNRIERV